MKKKLSEQELYEEFKYNLSRHIYRRNDRKTFIWGSGLGAELSAKILREMNIEVEGYIDNDKSKAGGFFSSKKIFAPDEIAFKSGEYFIVVASYASRSIMHQLFALGYKENDMCGAVLGFDRMPDMDCRTQLELTCRCNLRCHFCASWKSEHNRKNINNDMLVETAKKVIDSAVKLGIRGLQYSGGGENMLHKNYAEILHYAGTRFKWIFIVNNAQGLNSQITEALLSKEITSDLRVAFSITGYSADVYNEFQGSGSKDKTDKPRNIAYKKVLYFIEERNKKNENVKIELRYILTDDNLDDFRDYLKFWENKIDAMIVYPLQKGEVDHTGPIDENNIKNSVFKRCLQFSNMYVGADGAVSMCCKVNAPVMGNLYEKPLEEFYNNEQYLKAKNAMLNLNYDDLPENCKSCYFMYENEFSAEVDYLSAKKFDAHLDELKKYANGRPVLLFARCTEMNELFYSIYVNKTIEQFNLSICDPYEKGYYERFEILAPSVDVFKDKLVVCFDDFALRALDPAIRDAAYKTISYKNIRDCDDEE